MAKHVSFVGVPSDINDKEQAPADANIATDENTDADGNIAPDVNAASGADSAPNAMHTKKVNGAPTIIICAPPTNNENEGIGGSVPKTSTVLNGDITGLSNGSGNVVENHDERK